MPVFSGEKWDSQGKTTTTVTWSFAINNYPAMAQSFQGYLTFEGQIRDDYRDLVRKAFDAWEAVSNIDFVEVADSPQTDIRLGNIYIDGTPKPGQGSTLGIAKTWYQGSSYVAAQIYFDEDADDSRDVFYEVAVHEIGHAIGLEHSASPANVMYYLNNTQNASGKLSSDDIAGVQQLYGAKSGGGVTPPASGVSATDFAAVAASLFFFGKAPTATEFAERGSFAVSQYNYYAGTLKVANPAIGPYEAFGSSYATQSSFQSKYGNLNQSAFVQQAYNDVFKRAPTSSQFDQFNGQIEYFKAIYTGAGMSSSLADAKARGAAIGQMLGVAMTSASEKALPAQTLDDAVNAYFGAKAQIGLVGTTNESLFLSDGLV